MSLVSHQLISKYEYWQILNICYGLWIYFSCFFKLLKPEDKFFICQNIYFFEHLTNIMEYSIFDIQTASCFKTD